MDFRVFPVIPLLLSKYPLQPYFRSLHHIRFPNYLSSVFRWIFRDTTNGPFSLNRFQFQVLSCDKQCTCYSSILPYIWKRWLNSAPPCLCRIYSSDLFSFLSSFHSCCTKIHYNRYAILASDRNSNSFLCFPWYRWTVHYIYPWPRIQGNIIIAYPPSLY